MDVQYLSRQLVENLVYLASHGPTVVPFWAAVLYLVLLFTRKRMLKILCSVLGVADPVLVREIVVKVDLPLQLLLVLLAAMPFLQMVPGPAGILLSKASVFTALFLAVHVWLQGTDLVVFRWYLGERRHVSIPPVFHFLVLAGIYVAALLVLLDSVLGINIVPFLATSTVITAVLGLALQDTLRNLFAGITLSLEKSIGPGDWVMFRLDSANTRVGEITEIGWRSTKIRTVDNNCAVIPNALFTQNDLVNFSSPDSVYACTIQLPVTIGLEPSSIKRALENAAKSISGVLPSPVPEASAVDLQSDQITYQLRFWMNNFDKRESLTSEVIEACWQLLEELGAFKTEREEAAKRQSGS